jgi:hypothetical protein
LTGFPDKMQFARIKRIDFFISQVLFILKYKYNFFDLFKANVILNSSDQFFSRSIFLRKSGRL